MGMFGSKMRRKAEAQSRIEEVQQKKETSMKEEVSNLFNSGIRKGREMDGGLHTLREIRASVADKFAVGFTVRAFSNFSDSQSP